MKRLLCLVFCLTLLPAAGCGSDDRSPDLRDAADAPATDPDAARDAPASIAEALGEAFGGEGRATETVDFRTLRDLLPEDARGMERTDASGEKTGMAGFSVSQARGEYRSDDGGRRITLQIVDGGGMGRMAMLGASWLQMDFDRESTDGYERTTTYRGYPALEKLRTGDRPRAELQFVVADRFFVSADGHNVEMDALKDAAERIDFGALENLREAGAAQ